MSIRGRPFPRGMSGNPGGRPKELADLQKLAREQMPAAIKELSRLCVEAKSEMARIAAICALLDRGFGKPLQGVELSGHDGGPIEHKGVSDDARLEAFMAFLARTKAKLQG
jgi:hypothetical protein